MSGEIGPHNELALQYAYDVLDGNIVACELIKHACQRFIDDLERTDIYFDCERAEDVCEFIESLPHIKGEWARRQETIKLEPWQCFKLCNIFGWYYAEDTLNEAGDVIIEAGTRRFRIAFIDVGRKNAKSTVAAGVGLYMMQKDGEAGAEVYSSATTRNQAKIVFGVARLMALRKKDPKLDVRVHNINCLETASKFEPLHSQGETLDGHNIHCAINDELHAWKDRKTYDVIETATGSRKQPLIFNVTTAGYDTSGVCYHLRQYGQRLLEGKLDDDAFFCMIYTLDKKDDWKDRNVWIKSNPNLNVSVYPMDLETQARKAAEIPSQQNGFLVKRMNVWVNSAIAWMNMTQWEMCYDEEMALEDFAGDDCWAGIDLASKIDITSCAQVFSRQINGEQHLYAFMRHWLPESAIEEQGHGLYDGWRAAGLIRATPGNIIDVDKIENDLLDEVIAPFKLRELSVDPMHNSTQLSTHMAQRGIQTIDVRPTVANFSEAMKWLEAFVKDGRFHHNCPVLTWMISNVEVKEDYKDNIYPRKSAPDKKIDGVIALLMAVNRIMAGDTGYYPGEGVVIL
jgi:phage terminase large subunit-like protein